MQQFWRLQRFWIFQDLRANAELTHECWSLSSLRSFKKQANDVRPSNVLDLDGKLLRVIKAQHTHGAGRQLGSVQLELRELQSSTKRQLKMRPADTVEVARLEEKPMQLLYREGDTVHVMDSSTYEQLAIDINLFSELQQELLSEGMAITVSMHNSAAVNAALPPTIEVKIKQANASFKGETVSNSFKPAVLENGHNVLVPPFVTSSDRIIIDTTTGEFIKRA